MNLKNIFFGLLMMLLSSAAAQAQGNWTFENPTPVAGDITHLKFVTDRWGVLLTDGGLLRFTSDAGETWSRVELPPDEFGLKALDYNDVNLGWVIGSNNPDLPWEQYLYESTIEGPDWHRITAGTDAQPANLHVIQDLGSGQAWAGGTTYFEGRDYPYLVRIADHEILSSTLIQGGVDRDLNGLYFLNSRTGWAVGESGLMALTVNGVDWQVIDPVTEYDLQAVYFANPFDGWAVGGNFNHGVMITTDDGGESWEVLADHPALTRLVAIEPNQDRELIALSQGWNQFPAQVLHSGDGEHWEEITTFPDRTTHSLSGSGTRIWAGGQDSYLVRSDNGHDFRELSQNILPGAIYDFDQGSRIWIAGSNGLIYWRNPDESEWHMVETGLDVEIYNVRMNADGVGWLTAANSRELYTENWGQDWEERDFADEDVNLLKFIGPHGYATHGVNVSVTHDFGEHWTTHRVIRGQEIPAVALSVTSSEVAWVASAGDSLRTTTDGGETWRVVIAPFDYCYGISHHDGQAWALGSSLRAASRLYQSSDDGESWTTGARFEGTPGGILNAGSGFGWIWENPGRIWATHDDGQTWEDTQLGVNRIIRGLAADSDFRGYDLSAWGDGGLLARWSNPYVSAPEEDLVPPQVLLLTPAYPNPTNGFVSCAVKVPQAGVFQVKLFNLNGTQVMNRTVSYATAGQHHLNFSLNTLPTGIYWLRFGDSGPQATQKIVLLR